MTSSSGHLLLTVGIALMLVGHCAGDDVISGVIVNTRYGLLRGSRVQKDFGLGTGWDRLASIPRVKV